MPIRWFDRDNLLFRERKWERRGYIYRSVFCIQRWKQWLPEAGGLFRGGFPKRSLESISTEHLRRFEAETRRAEFSHWLPLPISAFFFLWNPVEIAVWMPVYAVVTNLPFILVQRSVRPRLKQLRERTMNKKRGLSHVAGSRPGPENPKDGFEPEFPVNE